MKRYFSYIVILVIMICSGCSNDPKPRRDIVMELAASMDHVFDSPGTRARELYGRYCSVCHGVTGQGDGFNAYNLTPRPRDFTDSAFVIRLDTNLIRETIAGGGGAVGLSPLMPTWGRTLSKSDIKELTDFVVYLSRRDSL